ncbi:hypothetical protein PIB30_086735 [Stylosanthes scabra]|uniref:BURP domain-containing protein n=1 Tax=Stylosanthes scabra TaxID=79078 RepID=A0ABU6XTU2_9FABA|nr:hypothetical protein [Stylosanthes scabra]
MPKAFKDLLVQPADWKTRRSQQAATSSKVKAPNGLFYLHVCDHHSRDQNKMDKTIPFYPIIEENDHKKMNQIDKTIPFYPIAKDSGYNKKSQNIIDKTIPFYPVAKKGVVVDKSIPFYPVAKESDHNMERQNVIDKTIPFYPIAKESAVVDKTIPFYPIAKESAVIDKTIPFYPVAKEDVVVDKTIPFYPVAKESNHNMESQNIIDKTIPFYPAAKESSVIDKTIPFYPVVKESYHHDHHMESQNTIDKTIPFYPVVKENAVIDKAIPFYPVGKEIVVDKTIPFYPVAKEDVMVDKTIPFYPVAKESYHNHKSQNTIDKTIPFYPLGKESDESAAKTFPPHHFHNKKRVDLTSNELIVPNGTFFFEHDLLPGKKLILGHIVPSDEFTFLPDKIAKTIPFSSNRLPEILNRLNIEADSAEAKSIKSSLEHCENPAMNGEDKYCATSLESLVDFAVSKLGRNIRLLSTEFERETQDRQYSVATEGAKKIAEKGMVCHQMDYPYAVFYCHKVKTRTYSVPLVASNDGTRVKAIAVCHPDTADWSPDYIPFKMLNTKPGATICHFLSTDTVIWVPRHFSSFKDDM